MTDPEMVHFLTRKRDEAAQEARRATDELARCEATLQQYLSGAPIPDIPSDDDDDTKPIEIWNQLLGQGIKLSRQEMFAALKAGGWARQYEVRAFNMAINTNLATGNIVQDADGLFYKPTPQERERILNAWREKRQNGK